MSGPRQTTVRRTAVLGGVVATLVLLVVVGVHVALLLAPAVVLVALVAVGWMPGEERLVRAMRRRAGRRTRGPAPRLRLRGPRVLTAHGRIRSGASAPRGPPRLRFA